MSKSIDVLLKIHHVHFVHPKFFGVSSSITPMLGGHLQSPQWLGDAKPASLSPPSVDAAASSFTGTASSPASWDGPISVGFNEKKWPTRNEQHQIHPINVKLKSTRSLLKGFPFRKVTNLSLIMKGLTNRPGPPPLEGNLHLQ